MEAVITRSNRGGFRPHVLNIRLELTRYEIDALERHDERARHIYRSPNLISSLALCDYFTEQDGFGSFVQLAYFGMRASLSFRITARDLEAKTYHLHFKRITELDEAELQVRENISQLQNDLMSYDKQFREKMGTRAPDVPAVKEAVAPEPRPEPEPPLPKSIPDFHVPEPQDDKGAELATLRRLYLALPARQDAFNKTRERRIAEAVSRITAGFRFDLLPIVAKVARDIFEQDEMLADLKEPPATFTEYEFSEWRAYLHHKYYFFDHAPFLINEMRIVLSELFDEHRHGGSPPGEWPFRTNLIKLVAHDINNFYTTLARAGPYRPLETGTMVHSMYPIFLTLVRELRRKKFEASGGRPNRRGWEPRYESSIVAPEDEVNLTDDALIAKYLTGLPLMPLFQATIPVAISIEDRFNHTHILGGAGAGKTSLIESIILHDLRSNNPPAMVVIDPHSDLVRRIAHADIGIEDRIIIIDPRDTEFPVALNPFALNRERLSHYDATTQEQMTANAIQTLNYLFSGLGLTLTGKQQTYFRYVVRLMLSLPETMGRNATILDMMKLMQDASPYQKAIAKLPEIQREFFATDFNTSTFRETKEQIRYRLQAIIESPTLARLFTAPETKVDIFSELNRGSIILVDAAKDFLKDGSDIFGRLIISLVLQAVLERAAIPETERRSAFLIVDEAGSFFDTNIDDLLTDARKYKCGCLFAHQHLSQATTELRASLAANTGIKFASGLSAGDARAMASDMRVDPGFLHRLPKLHFAVSNRNDRTGTVEIAVTPGVLASLPNLSPDRFTQLVERNRQRVSIPPQGTPTPPQGEPSEDISSTW